MNMKPIYPKTPAPLKAERFNVSKELDNTSFRNSTNVESVTHSNYTIGVDANDFDTQEKTPYKCRLMKALNSTPITEALGTPNASSKKQGDGDLELSSAEKSLRSGKTYGDSTSPSIKNISRDNSINSLNSSTNKTESNSMSSTIAPIKEMSKNTSISKANKSILNAESAEEKVTPETDTAENTSTNFSQLWSQAVRVEVNGNSKIDMLLNVSRVTADDSVSKNDKPVVGSLNLSSPSIKSRNTGDSEEEYDEDNGSKETNSLIEDEAMEVSDNYCSGDSMSLSMREEMAENEIPVYGESLGSKTTDDEDEEKDSDESSQDSFIVSDTDEILLECSENEENLLGFDKVKEQMICEGIMAKIDPSTKESTKSAIVPVESSLEAEITDAFALEVSRMIDETIRDEDVIKHYEGKELDSQANLSSETKQKENESAKKCKSSAPLVQEEDITINEFNDSSREDTESSSANNLSAAAKEIEDKCKITKVLQISSLSLDKKNNIDRFSNCNQEQDKLNSSAKSPRHRSGEVMSSPKSQDVNDVARVKSGSTNGKQNLSSTSRNDLSSDSRSDEESSELSQADTSQTILKQKSLSNRTIENKSTLQIKEVLVSSSNLSEDFKQQSDDHVNEQLSIDSDKESSKPSQLGKISSRGQSVSFHSGDNTKKDVQFRMGLHKSFTEGVKCKEPFVPGAGLFENSQKTMMNNESNSGIKFKKLVSQGSIDKTGKHIWDPSSPNLNLRKLNTSAQKDSKHKLPDHNDDKEHKICQEPETENMKWKRKRLSMSFNENGSSDSSSDKESQQKKRKINRDKSIESGDNESGTPPTTLESHHFAIGLKDTLDDSSDTIEIQKINNDKEKPPKRKLEGNLENLESSEQQGDEIPTKKIAAIKKALTASAMIIAKESVKKHKQSKDIVVKPKQLKGKKDKCQLRNEANMENVESPGDLGVSFPNIISGKKTAIAAALKTSAVLIGQELSKNRNQSNVPKEHSHSKKLPTELLKLLSYNTKDTGTSGKAKNKKMHPLKSSAGVVFEEPIEPAKIEKFKLSTGVVLVEPVTPAKPVELTSGFRVSPITPSTGFKVRRLLTGCQDTPPTVLPTHHRKRKHVVKETESNLPQPKWTKSGAFHEENLSPKSIIQAGATEFQAVALGQKNTAYNLSGTAVNFKQAALAGSNKQREPSKKMLQRKERSRFN